MNQTAYEREVWGAVAGRPYLLPVFGGALCIPQKLQALNLRFYVVLNVIRLMQKAAGLPYQEWTGIPSGVTPRYNAWYEVRKLDTPHWMNSGCVLPFGPLDDRALPFVWEHDTEIHGDDVWRRMDEHNAAIEAESARKTKNMAQAAARELKSAAARDAWGPSIFGYGAPPKTTY